jgi:hypothetical protein
MAEQHEDRLRAEQVLKLMKRYADNPVTEFVRNSPFLVLSLGIHLAILILLALVTAQETPPPKKKITVKMEDFQAQEVEMQPLRKQQNLAEAAASGGASGSSMGGGVAGEGHGDAVADTAAAEVGRVNILGLKSAVGGGGTGQFEGKGGSGFGIAGGGKGRGSGSVSGAVDQFAVVTINAVQNGKTLVALLIDRSRSVIYGDLPKLIERMDHYFSEIDHNLPSGLESRGRWVVVSYGHQPKFKCKPSADLDYVKAALRNVEVDYSGRENVGAAVETVLDRFSGSEYDNLLIAAMTDESGDDIKNGALLERVINRMRRARAQFFVFGYEATFAAQKKRIRFKLDPESVTGADRNAIRGFEGRVIHGWANGGPETPRPELWWGQNWHQWRYWGSHLNNVPSGFGMYGLNRMVLATGGIYFLITNESDYDDEKLYAKYKPDICSKHVYDRRMKQSDLRRELQEVWSEIGYFNLRHRLRNNRQVNRSLEKSRKGRIYCTKRAEQLLSLVHNSTPQGNNWTRWRAHTDVTVAELLRYKFMLGQYHAVLKRAWVKQGRTVPQPPRDHEKYTHARLLVRRGRAPEDFMGPEQAKREYDQARQRIQLVIDRHKNTPWAILGRRMKRGLYPWTCTYQKIKRRKRKKNTGQPSPPSLSF